MIHKHDHLIVQASVRRPIHDCRQAERWLTDMVQNIGMELMCPVIAKYSDRPGNRGITAAALITTSHLVMHIWDEEKPAEVQFDIYSCAEFDARKIMFAIKESFDAISISYRYIDRQRGLQIFNEDQGV